MPMSSAHVLFVFGSCEFLQNKKSGTNNKIRDQNYILVFLTIFLFDVAQQGLEYAIA